MNNKTKIYLDTIINNLSKIFFSLNREKKIAKINKKKLQIR